jgi:hypothetical protein
MPSRTTRRSLAVLVDAHEAGRTRQPLPKLSPTWRWWGIATALRLLKPMYQARPLRPPSW